MSAEFIYTGKVEGKMESTSTGKPVFKGTVGDMPVWVYGRSGQVLSDLVGRYALVRGTVESRIGNGRTFVRTNVLNAAAADPKHQVNVVVLNGEVTSTRRIKEGLYEAEVTVQGNILKDGKRLPVAYNIPVATSAVTESDIGKQVTVTGYIAVRQGKFTDIVAKGVAFANSAPSNEIEEEELL